MPYQTFDFAQIKTETLAVMSKYARKQVSASSVETITDWESWTVKALDFAGGFPNTDDIEQFEAECTSITTGLAEELAKKLNIPNEVIQVAIEPYNKPQIGTEI